MAPVDWQRLGAKASAEWAGLLAQAKDSSPLQSWPWGEFKRLSGWEPERWVARGADGEPRCCLQILKKKTLGRVLVWAPGGPVIGFPHFVAGDVGGMLETWIGMFRRENKLAYVRFNSFHESSEPLLAAMGERFKAPSAKINSGVSISIDLSPPMESLRSRMTSKHRYYVKQSLKAGLDWEHGHSEALVSDLSGLYGNMIRAKGIAAKSFDPGVFKDMCSFFGPDCVILVGYQKGAPVTACLVFIAGEASFYQSAATGPLGRKSSAAYAMVFKLFEVLKERGAVRFDFGGISPSCKELAGVNHFKKGFGGGMIEYLGEWEWAPSRFLSWGANYMIKRKKNL